MCQTRLSPMNAHSWPRSGGSRKELLMSGLALAPYPKWEVDNRRPLCIQSTLNYPGADSPLCGGPLLPLSPLQLSALWPFSCPSEPQSEGGQVEEGRGSKIQIDPEPLTKDVGLMRKGSATQWKVYTVMIPSVLTQKDPWPFTHVTMYWWKIKIQIFENC